MHACFDLLSTEAVARLKFSDFVEIDHVREAVYIFRSSLQRIVYNQDVVLLDPEERMPDADSGKKEDGEHDENQQAENGKPDGTDSKPRQIRMSQQDFRRIATQLVEYITQLERDKEESGQVFEGVKSSAVIEWYVPSFPAVLGK